MTKEQIINKLNNKFNFNLNTSNTNLSNINSNGIWSIEPNFKRSISKLYLVLNNNKSRKIHVFEIPANHSIYGKLYKRNDRPVFRLLLNVSDTEFIENLARINFNNFHKGYIEYL